MPPQRAKADLADQILFLRLFLPGSLGGLPFRARGALARRVATIAGQRTVSLAAAREAIFHLYAATHEALHGGRSPNLGHCWQQEWRFLGS